METSNTSGMLKQGVVLKNRIPIIIPLFNCVEYTKQAVDSIRKNTHPNMYEVVFVDNGSTDGTKSYLKQLTQDDPEHFRVVTNEKNLGFAGGVNVGLQLISGFQWEYACIANNDLLFTPDWLFQMLSCFVNDKVGAVGPVSNAAGGSQGISVGYQDVAQVDQWAVAYHQANEGRRAEVGRLIGLCFLMSRKFFDCVGYLDTRFINGMWEDNDFCVSADTKIPLVDGTTKTIKELSDKTSFDGMYVYSIDPSGKIVPGKVNSVWKVGTKQTVKITLDNQESLRCTLDHKVMLRDGTYIEAKDLVPGNSLMPLYRRYDQAHLPGKEQKHKVCLNHKVVKVELCGIEDVYDMEVEKFHNFSVVFSDNSGVFVHNCLRGRIAGFTYVVDHSTVLHHYFHKSFQGNKFDSGKLFRENKDRYVSKWMGADSVYEKLAEANLTQRKGHGVIVPGRFDDQKVNGKFKKFVVGACRVKDGADYIGRAIERVSEIADEIVVLVSKLTTDNTKEICKKYPKVVIVEDDADDQPGAKESDSRNRLLDLAYSRYPDWIYLFDHDELPSKFLVKNFQKLVEPKNPEILMWAFPIVQLWNDEKSRRIDGLWGNFWQGRMFRALPGLRINNSNNLLHCGAIPSFPSENHGLFLGKIIHYGNIKVDYRKQKSERYTKIDTDKDLNMVLGAHKEHYWTLYYGQANPQEKAAFNGQWGVLPDPSDWCRPPYGKFFDRDVYRHVHDEAGLVLVPFDEDVTISVSMLIHNEGDLLGNCLNSARPLADEIVCIDTGCVDATPEIAEQFGADVYKFPWNNNFSDARNFSLEKSTGTWILRLDPDEVLPPDAVRVIPSLVKDESVEGYIFPITNWLEDPRGNQNANWVLSETCRLFRNRYPEIKYTGLVHEELDDSFLALKEKRRAALVANGYTDEQINRLGVLLDIRRSPVPLWHFGYLRGTQFLDQKFAYYCQLGHDQIRATPNDPRPYFTTAVHFLHVGQHEKAVQNYKKTIELDPTHHMALNDLGVMFWTQGNLAKAEEYFRKALSTMNEHVHQFHKDKVAKNLEKVRTQSLMMMLLP